MKALFRQLLLDARNWFWRQGAQPVYVQVAPAGQGGGVPATAAPFG